MTWFIDTIRTLLHITVSYHRVYRRVLVPCGLSLVHARHGGRVRSVCAGTLRVPRVPSSLFFFSPVEFLLSLSSFADLLRFSSGARLVSL